MERDRLVKLLQKIIDELGGLIMESIMHKFMAKYNKECDKTVTEVV